MLKPLKEWNPFDVLFERDSDTLARPDLAFLENPKKNPVVGRCTIARQKEYGRRQRHDQVLSLIDDLVDRRGVAAIDIDTRWPKEYNSTGLHSPAAVSSVIARVDAVITNRLHGLVFALSNGVPVLAIDAVAGGDKLSAQARVLEWPVCFRFEDATPEALNRALDWCLSEEARSNALQVSERALSLLSDYDRDFGAAINDSKGDEKRLDANTESRWRFALRQFRRPVK